MKLFDFNRLFNVNSLNKELKGDGEEERMMKKERRKKKRR